MILFTTDGLIKEKEAKIRGLKNEKLLKMLYQ